MKRILIVFSLSFFIAYSLFAQDNSAQLAAQYNENGEPQKALEIIQKLYKENNEAYYTQYVNSLLGLKKFDEAINISKKMMRKHPGERQYVMQLGATLTQQGNIDKANALYDDIIANLQPDQSEIAMVASSFIRSLISITLPKLF